MLELRVLTGTHAGARVLLPDTPQQLGSDPSCDLVLSDEGLLARHAAIEAQEDGTVVLRWLSDPPRELVLSPGEAVDLGPVRIAIEEADSPWREDVPLREPDAMAEIGDLAPGAGDTDPERAARRNARKAANPAAGAAAGTGVGGSASWLADQLTRAGPALVWVLAALGGLGLLATLLINAGGLATTGASPSITSGITPGTTPTDPSASAGAAPGRPTSPTAEAMAQASAVIEPLGLGKRVRIEPDRLAGLRVRAAFLDEGQVQSLREALARLPTPPRLQVMNAGQIQSQLDEALITQDTGTATQLEAVPTGEGRYRIQGRVASPGQREALMALLARAAPLAQGLESALRTGEDEAQALLQAMKELGLAEVDGEWTGTRLEARVRIQQAALPRWERALAGLATQHPVPFRVSITRLIAPTVTALPFALRSVVGGTMPFVTLGDGRRLTVDGQVDGWRLLAIRPEAVVFENAEGARITLER